MLPFPDIIKFQIEDDFHIRSYAIYAVLFILELEKLWWAWVMQIAQALHLFLRSLLLYIVVCLSTRESRVYLESQDLKSI